MMTTFASVSSLPLAYTVSLPIYLLVCHRSRNSCKSTREVTSFGFSDCPALLASNNLLLFSIPPNRRRTPIFVAVPKLVYNLVTSSKISYCIGNINDPQYQYNELSLGNGAIMEGDSTTLETYRGLYYLDLQGISVGEKKLQIDPLVFKRGLMGQGGVIIDSGTTLTPLKEEVYVPLQNEVESLMAGKLERVSNPEFFCYAVTWREI
ncbi:hypothetical protein NL676_019178 [Syzygium grande]|nr:hypothetical protein NL676_019178 [Syzygium grande]